jgi:hypothetical protein
MNTGLKGIGINEIIFFNIWISLQDPSRKSPAAGFVSWKDLFVKE